MAHQSNRFSSNGGRKESGFMGHAEGGGLWNTIMPRWETVGPVIAQRTAAPSRPMGNTHHGGVGVV